MRLALAECAMATAVVSSAKGEQRRQKPPSAQNRADHEILLQNTLEGFFRTPFDSVVKLIGGSGASKFPKKEDLKRENKKPSKMDFICLRSHVQCKLFLEATCVTERVSLHFP